MTYKIIFYDIFPFFADANKNDNVAETHVDDSTANSHEQLSEDPQSQHEGQQHWHDHGHEHEHGHGHEQHENQHHQEQLQQQDGQPGSHEQEEIGVFYETFLHYVEFSKFFVSEIFLENSTLCYHYFFIYSFPNGFTNHFTEILSTELTKGLACLLDFSFLLVLAFIWFHFLWINVDEKLPLKV